LVLSAAVGSVLVGMNAADPGQHVEAELSGAAAVRAFPGAEGFGTDTAGGRGGQVLQVTNLNDSGPGSLRAALTASGPRTVVFTVSGTIRLQSRIDVVDPYLTVAGQTAPGGGITLRMDPTASPCTDKGTMKVATHDVVIRYLRLRPGPTPCADDSHDALAIYEAGTENVVIDHVSMSWAVDEVLNTYDGSQNITISNSIIAEALSNSTHPEGEHSKGSLLGGVGAHNVSMHGNLFVSNKDRNPQISGLSVADVRNNVIYNYGTGSGSGVTLVSSSKGEPRVNWVGNYYKPGPSSDPSRPEYAVYSGTTGATWQWYGDGNMRWTAAGLQPARVHSGAAGSRVQTPFAVAPVTTTSAATAYTDVLAYAGATAPYRDAVDQRLVTSVKDGTGRIIDDPSQVGGYPSLPAAQAPADDDKDGMPNSAEVAYGTNPSVPDSSGDVDGNGYTNIEDWFNGLTTSATPTASPTASPTTSPTTSPTASPTTSPTTSPTASPTPSPTSDPTAPATVTEARAATSSDDAEERASGAVSLDSSDLELVADGSSVQTVGVRFPSLSVPRGATIVRAWIQFTTDEAKTGVTNLTLAAQASDNAPTFVSSSRNISLRPRTAASVAWTPPVWSTIRERGSSQQSPDLAAPLQEVVSRAGWTAGNAVAILVTGTGARTAYAFDRSAAQVPTLHVEYLP
jgi:hypothetical protein